MYNTTIVTNRKCCTSTEACNAHTKDSRTVNTDNNVLSQFARCTHSHLQHTTYGGYDVRGYSIIPGVGVLESLVSVPEQEDHS